MPSPAARRPVAVVTGRPPGPPWSGWPAGVGTATTVTTGIRTASVPAAALAVTSAARSGTAAKGSGQNYSGDVVSQCGGDRGGAGRDVRRGIAAPGRAAAAPAGR